VPPKWKGQAASVVIGTKTTKSHLSILHAAAVEVYNVTVSQGAHKLDFREKIVFGGLVHMKHSLLKPLDGHLNRGWGDQVYGEPSQRKSTRARSSRRITG
jgi:hypothetical protein